MGPGLEPPCAACPRLAAVVPVGWQGSEACRARKLLPYIVPASLKYTALLLLFFLSFGELPGCWSDSSPSSLRMPEAGATQRVRASPTGPELASGNWLWDTEENLSLYIRQVAAQLERVSLSLR